MLEELIKAAPQLGLGILFLVALAIVLREYRSLRGEIAKAVEEAVNARLGSMYGSLQIEASRAKELLDGIGTAEERISEALAGFETKRSDLDIRFERLRERLQQLDEAVPELSDLSAFDRVVLARSAGAATETIKLLTDVLNDPDATSQDLEMAGDTAGKIRRFALAKELYEKAVERDPANDSAKSELVAIKMWLEPSSRDQSIQDARDLLHSGKGTSDMLATLANSLMRLKRFDDLERLCRDLLEVKGVHSDLRAQAERELAIALMARGETKEAEEHFKRSMELRDDNANTIKAYVALLVKNQSFDEARVLVSDLVMIDPTEHTYYLIGADVEEAAKNHSEALNFYERASEFCPVGGEKQILDENMRRARLRIQVSQQRSASVASGAAQQGDAADRSPAGR